MPNISINLQHYTVKHLWHHIIANPFAITFSKVTILLLVSIIGFGTSFAGQYPLTQNIQSQEPAVQEHGFGAIAHQDTPQASKEQPSAIQLKYCIDPDWAPYESIENGEHVGISKHYMALINRKLPMPFEFSLVPTSNWQETISAFKAGKCQLIPLLNYSRQRTKYMAFSNIYFKAPNVIFAHYNHPLIGNIAAATSERIAVVKGYRLMNYLKTVYPDLALVEVDSERHGLKMVNDGDVDLFIGSFYSSNHIIQNGALHNLRIIGLAELHDNLRMGISLDLQDLLPELNLAIASISEEEHREIFSQLKDGRIVEYYDYQLAWQVAAVAFVVLLVGAARHYEALKQRQTLADKNKALEKLHNDLARKNELLENMAIHDALTGLYNREYFREQVEKSIKHKKRRNSQHCMLMLDIDNFKQYNDNYGHSIGDDVIKHVANSITACIREIDICARWGGEEFVILCPESQLNEALIVANRFQDYLSEHSLNAHHDINHISCSIGIALLPKDSNQKQWFNNADSAMYQAKANGKNSIVISSE